MSQIRELLNKKEKNIALILSVLVLVISLIPLYIIAHFNYPTSDDFAYASSIYWGIRNGHGIGQIIRDSWDTAIRFYLTWQGRYFDDIVSAFGVGIAVPQLYCLGTYLVLTVFVIASIWFVRIITYKVCKWDSTVSWIVALWFTIVQVWYVPHVVEAFYWYVGATGYTMTYALSLLLVTALICFYNEKTKSEKILYGILAVILPIMIGGSNYAGALLMLEILVVAIVIAFIHKKKCAFMIAVTMEYICCFACNVFSPGNRARMNNVESLGGVGSIIASLKQAAVFCKEWFRLPVFILLILIVVLSYGQLRKMSYEFKLPGIVTMVSFGLLASILTPPFYAGATWGPGRLINIEYYCYYIFLIGNILYWIGWITHKRKQNVESRNIPSLHVVGIACIAFLICFKIYGLQSVSSTSALLSIAKGEAKQYQIENQQRWVLYEDENIKNVEVEEFSARPHVLYYDDIQVDKTDWRNYTVAEFFRKESVKIYSE